MKGPPPLCVFIPTKHNAWREILPCRSPGKCRDKKSRQIWNLHRRVTKIFLQIEA